MILSAGCERYLTHANEHRLKKDLVSPRATENNFWTIFKPVLIEQNFRELHYGLKCTAKMYVSAYTGFE